MEKRFGSWRIKLKEAKFFFDATRLLCYNKLSEKVQDKTLEAMTKLGYFYMEVLETMDTHGAFAKIGDLVEIYNPMGKSTGIRGVVYEINIIDRAVFREPKKRYLWVSGHATRVSDHNVRIVSKGECAQVDGRD